MTYRVVSFEKRGQATRAWWQTCSVEAFRQQIEPMSVKEREILLQEIAGAVAVTSTVVQDVTAEPGHRARARRALGFISEKRRILSALMTGANERRKDKRRESVRVLLAEIVRTADAGDAIGAVRLLERAIREMWNLDHE